MNDTDNPSARNSSRSKGIDSSTAAIGSWPKNVCSERVREVAERGRGDGDEKLDTDEAPPRLHDAHTQNKHDRHDPERVIPGSSRSIRRNAAPAPASASAQHGIDSHACAVIVRGNTATARVVASSSAKKMTLSRIMR